MDFNDMMYSILKESLNDMKGECKNDKESETLQDVIHSVETSHVLSKISDKLLADKSGIIIIASDEFSAIEELSAKCLDRIQEFEKDTFPVTISRIVDIRKEMLSYKLTPPEKKHHIRFYHFSI